MFTFSKSRRNNLLELLPEIARDETIFEDIFKRFEEQRDSLGERKIDVALELSAEKKIVNDAFKQLLRMVDDDVALVHLLMQLHRQGKIEHADELIGLAKKMLKDTKKSYRWLSKKYTELSKKFHNVPEKKVSNKTFNMTVGPIFEQITKIKDQYETISRMFNVIIKTEHHDLVDIEMEIRKGLALSEKVAFRVKKGSFRVELHESYRKYEFNKQGQLYVDEKKVGPALLIYKHDYLVAEIKLRSYEHRRICAHKSVAYLRGEGYVQQAIEVIFDKNKIDEWISDNALSPYAKNMYERLKERFSVEIISNDRRRVTRKK